MRVNHSSDPRRVLRTANWESCVEARRDKLLRCESVDVERFRRGAAALWTMLDRSRKPWSRKRVWVLCERSPILFDNGWGKRSGGGVAGAAAPKPIGDGI
jgi:hypothetical protein